MPRGVYNRAARTQRAEQTMQQKVAAAVGQATEQMKEQVDGAVKEATERFDREVASITQSIRQEHGSIQGKTLEIGRKLFSIRKLIESLEPDVRRAAKIPTFSSWMNVVAPQSNFCNMSKRAVWSYYRAYSEAQAAGLDEKTITALAPSVLKSEKPRQAFLKVVSKDPELAAKLNEVSGRKQIHDLAQSEPVQKILARIQESRGPAELEVGIPRQRMKRAILSALKPAFPAKREDFNLETANNLISDLVYAVREACTEMKIQAYVPVGYVRMTEKDADVWYASTASPQPAQQDLVTAVSVSASKALASTAAAVAAA